MQCTISRSSIRVCYSPGLGGRRSPNGSEHASGETLKGRMELATGGVPKSVNSYLPVTVVCAMFLLCGCSIQRFAINKVGNALASGGSTYQSDDDPDLVGQALPFGLKLIESLLAESPRHPGLLFAAASGFTPYAYAFVQEDADELEDRDFTRATALRVRARRLYLRARDHGIRGLEVSHKGFGEALRRDPAAAVRRTTRKDVPLLYWTAASWGAAISLSKDNPDLIGDQPIMEALIDRALELDEKFGSGDIHTFLITYEASRNGAEGDAAGRSRKHFDRAMELSGACRRVLWSASRRPFPCRSRTARSSKRCSAGPWRLMPMPSRSSGWPI